MTRRVRSLTLICSVVLGVAACAGGSDEAETALPDSTTASEAAVAEADADASSDPAGEEALREAVQAYSDAFLNADPVEAYEYFSVRCAKQTSLSYFTGIVTAAKELYGAALPIKDYDAEVAGNLARVTYTYDVPALSQTREPWSREDGAWKLDDC
jgi:hypothetical protein